jgi:hypothetical protein
MALLRIGSVLLYKLFITALLRIGSVLL